MDLHVAFPSRRPAFHFHQWQAKVPLLTNTCSLIFLTLASLSGRVGLMVAVISVSPTISDVKHLVMCLLFICIPCFENVYLDLPPILAGLFVGSFASKLFEPLIYSVH